MRWFWLLPLSVRTPTTRSGHRSGFSLRQFFIGLDSPGSRRKAIMRQPLFNQQKTFSNHYVFVVLKLGQAAQDEKKERASVELAAENHMAWKRRHRFHVASKHQISSVFISEHRWSTIIHIFFSVSSPKQHGIKRNICHNVLSESLPPRRPSSVKQAAFALLLDFAPSLGVHREVSRWFHAKVSKVHKWNASRKDWCESLKIKVLSPNKGPGRKSQSYSFKGLFHLYFLRQWFLHIRVLRWMGLTGFPAKPGAIKRRWHGPTTHRRSWGLWGTADGPKATQRKTGKTAGPGLWK